MAGQGAAYDEMSSWTEDTPIKYVPGAKKGNTKSAERYERYSQATTIGEALRLGSKPEDLVHDYQKGFFEVLKRPAASTKAKPDRVEQQDGKSDAKNDAKGGAKGKGDAKGDAKSDAKSRADAKSEAKSDPKSDARSRGDAKSEAKSDAKGKPDSKADAKDRGDGKGGEGKSDARSEVKADIKKGAVDYVPTAKGATPMGTTLWTREEKLHITLNLCDHLGIDLKAAQALKDVSETAEMTAERLAADQMALVILEAVEQEGRRVTDLEVLAVLHLWAFKKNETRLNVMPEGQSWVHSDTLGLVRSRTGGFVITGPTREYPHVTKLLNRWLKDRRPADMDQDFPFTSISLNYNYAARRHRDGNNHGPSMIQGFGKFTGGQLRYWPDDDRSAAVEDLPSSQGVPIDITEGLVLFDGCRGHEVADFEGERYSMVFFSSGKFWTMDPEQKEYLTSCGFVIPDGQDLGSVDRMLPAPRGYTGCRSLDKMFGVARQEKPKILQWAKTVNSEEEDSAKRLISAFTEAWATPNPASQNGAFIRKCISMRGQASGGHPPARPARTGDEEAMEVDESNAAGAPAAAPVAEVAVRRGPLDEVFHKQVETVPTEVRKEAAAPPAPAYRGTLFGSLFGERKAPQQVVKEKPQQETKDKPQQETRERSLQETDIDDYVPTAKGATPMGTAIWTREEKVQIVRNLCNHLGIDLKAAQALKDCPETAEMTAERLAADQIALVILEAVEEEKRRVTDFEILSVLHLWAFKKNETRLNVMPEGQSWVHSDTLGLVRSRCGGFLITAPTREYPHVAKILNRWLKDRRPEGMDQDFPFTSISLNYNYAARRHRDGNNHGPSMIQGFGKYTGGRLRYWPDDDRTTAVEDLPADQGVALDISEGLVLFDGCRGHEVEDFGGERYSAVFFSSGKFWTMDKEQRDFLLECGFVIPEGQTLGSVDKMLPAPRGYTGCKSIDKMFGFGTNRVEKPKLLQWPKTVIPAEEESARRLINTFKDAWTSQSAAAPTSGKQRAAASEPNEKRGVARNRNSGQEAEEVQPKRARQEAAAEEAPPKPAAQEAPKAVNGDARYHQAAQSTEDTPVKYDDMSTWTEDTPIKYVPGAKKGASKSAERYERYSQAKTVGEALRLGSKPEDLVHDFQKGFVEVVGHRPATAKAKAEKVVEHSVAAPRAVAPPAEETKTDDTDYVPTAKGATPMGSTLWTREEKLHITLNLCDHLGIDLKAAQALKDTCETAEMTAERLAADQMALVILEAVEQDKRRVTDLELLAVLHLWAFKKNETRLNVMPEGQSWVHSDTLGLVRSRTGGFVITAPTREYPHMAKILNRWLQDRRPAELEEDFPFTSISLNYNYAARRHRDGNNHGPSMIQGFGKFKGGRLRYWPDDDRSGAVEDLPSSQGVAIDITDGLVLFDGCRGHEVEDFDGERYSVVFFSSGKFWTMDPAQREYLRSCGFVIPDGQDLGAVDKMLPPPRGYTGCRSLDKMFGIARRDEKPNIMQWSKVVNRKEEEAAKSLISAFKQAWATPNPASRNGGFVRKCISLKGQAAAGHSPAPRKTRGADDEAMEVDESNTAAAPAEQPAVRRGPLDEVFNKQAVAGPVDAAKKAPVSPTPSSRPGTELSGEKQLRGQEAGARRAAVEEPQAKRAKQDGAPNQAPKLLDMDAAYEQMATWTEDTPVKYVPGAKKGNTKSAERYECYSQARTIGEALRLGSKPEDLLHDFQRGFFEVVGQTRQTPAVIVSKQAPTPSVSRQAPAASVSKTASAPAPAPAPAPAKTTNSKTQKESTAGDAEYSPVAKGATPMGTAIWTREEKMKITLNLCDHLGIDLKAAQALKDTCETAEMTAERLAADQMALVILEAVEEEKRRVTDLEVLSVLHLWAFKKNETRLNVMPEGQSWVHSDTLGLVRSRCGGFCITGPTREYPHVAKLLNRWLRDRRPEEFDQDFPFTSISMNYNYAARRHRDGNNHGPSMIQGFGKFTGGKLCYWPDDDRSGAVEDLPDRDKMAIDIAEGLALFDGCRGHEVEDFEGERYSLVFFSAGKFWTMEPDQREYLQSCGFVIPEGQCLGQYDKVLPVPRGYTGCQSLDKMFGVVRREKEKPKLLQWPKQVNEQEEEAARRLINTFKEAWTSPNATLRNGGSLRRCVAHGEQADGGAEAAHASRSAEEAVEG